MSQLPASLNGLNYVKIEQNPDWWECFLPCCCEIENKYNIYDRNSGNIGQLLEQSGFLCRICCKWNREFTSKLNDPQGNESSNSVRPFKCPLLWFCRPVMEIYKNQDKIGELRAPYLLCAPCLGCNCLQVEVLDSAGNEAFVIDNPCPQMGQLFGAPCCRMLEPCKLIEYKIKDASKEEVGRIENEFYGANAIGCCLPRCQKYVINFPDSASPEKKILLIYATIFIDFLQWMG